MLDQFFVVPHVILILRIYCIADEMCVPLDYVIEEAKPKAQTPL